MRLTLPIFVLVFVVSCTTTPKYHPVLNLVYTSPSTTTQLKEDVKIAIVKAQYTAEVEKKAMQQFLNLPLGAEENLTPDIRLKVKFNNEYVPKLQNTMFTDMEKVIAGKGLKVYQSYESLDEIPYIDKKKIDLILIPTFDFHLVVRNEIIPELFEPRYEGTIQLLGKMKLVFLEPISKEKIIIKTIDVSSLNNSATYKSNEEADDQLITLLNTIYPQLMQKVASVIDTEEILSIVPDVKHLKEKYR